MFIVIVFPVTFVTVHSNQFIMYHEINQALEIKSITKINGGKNNEQILQNV